MSETIVDKCDIPWYFKKETLTPREFELAIAEEMERAVCLLRYEESTPTTFAVCSRGVRIFEQMMEMLLVKVCDEI